MLLSKPKRKSPLLGNGYHNVTLTSIHEAPWKLVLKFTKANQFISLERAINEEVLDFIGNLGFRAGLPAGVEVKLSDLVGAKLKIEVYNNQVIYIK